MLICSFLGFCAIEVKHDKGDGQNHCSNYTPDRDASNTGSTQTCNGKESLIIMKTGIILWVVIFKQRFILHVLEITMSQSRYCQ